MFGVDYYPEHWDIRRLKRDLKIIKEYGMKVIRIGEFIWSDLEPEEGRYNFEILDRVFEESEKLELNIILGTPTATPPIWLVEKYPEILQMDKYKRVRPFGSRRHYCYSSDVYKDYSAIIAQKYAKRYGRNNSLFAWQIDNEFGCENTTFCYCENCERRFKEFLRKKYNGEIGQLNSSWGTSFWSQKYSSFDQIGTPIATNAALNPHQVLDFYRFTTDSIDKFAENQIEVIKKYSDAKITHNFMVNFTEIDYKKHSRFYDFISYDNYSPYDEFKPLNTAFNYDLMWSLMRKPFTIMEQQPGRVNWQIRNKYYPAKWIRPSAESAEYHGADNIVYFRFRANPYGAEQWHNGILSYDGNPENSERLKIIKELSRTEKISIRPKSKAAIYFDYENAWIHEINNVSKDFNYIESIIDIYAALRNLGYFVDVVFDDSEIDEYELLIVPYAVVLSEEFKDKIYKYRGKLFITCMTDLKNIDNSIQSSGLPGFSFEDLKFNIVDFGAVSDESVILFDKTYKANYWIEELKVIEGNSAGKWKSYPNKEYVAYISSADGRKYYVSSVFGRDFWLKLFSEVTGKEIINENDEVEAIMDNEKLKKIKF